MKKSIDIRSQDIKIIRQILTKYLSPETEIWVFGSRAKGTARPFSDLDLVINANHHPLSIRVMTQLLDEFEESDLPYKVDIVDWNTVDNEFKTLIYNERILFPLYTIS